MKFLGMGMPELLIILAVALLIFGPKHLPKLGSALGSTVKNLRDGLGADNKEEQHADMVEDDAEDEKAAPRKTAKSIEGGANTKGSSKAKASSKSVA
jgi:sec-independent protein translocase protein TatA